MYNLNEGQCPIDKPITKSEKQVSRDVNTRYLNTENVLQFSLCHRNSKSGITILTAKISSVPVDVRTRNLFVVFNIKIINPEMTLSLFCLQAWIRNSSLELGGVLC